MPSLVKANKSWLWSRTVIEVMKRKKEQFIHQTLLGTKSYVLTQLENCLRTKTQQHNKAKKAVNI